MTKNKTLLRILIVAAIAALMIGGYFFMEPIVDFVSEPERIRAWIQAKGIWGVLGFACMNMLQVCLALVPSGPFSLSAGYVFGPLKGTLLCVISCSIASAFVFLMVKHFGMKLVSIFVSQDQLALLEGYGENEELSKKIERMLMLIFVVPGSPKDPLTYLAGITNIPLPLWVLVNLVGRIPGTGITALGGSAVGGNSKLSLIAAVGGVIVLILVGKSMRRMIRKES